MSALDESLIRDMLEHCPELREAHRRLTLAATAPALTRKQAECLAVIRGLIEAHGVSPSYDEIADALGLSGKPAVVRLVDALEERGAIVRRPRRARSIAIVEHHGLGVGGER